MVTRLNIVTDFQSVNNGKMVFVSEDDLATVGHTFRVFIGITDPSGVEIHPYQEVVPDMTYISGGADSLIEGLSVLAGGVYLRGTYVIKIKEEYDPGGITPAWVVNNEGEISIVFKPDVYSLSDPQSSIVGGAFKLSCVTGEVTFTDTTELPEAWTFSTRPMLRVEAGATPSESASVVNGDPLPVVAVTTNLEWNNRLFVGRIVYSMSRQEQPETWFVITFSQKVSNTIQYVGTCDFDPCGLASKVQCFLDSMGSADCKYPATSTSTIAAKLSLLLSQRNLYIECGNWSAVVSKNKEISEIIGAGCGTSASSAMTRFAPLT